MLSRRRFLQLLLSAGAVAVAEPKRTVFDLGEAVNKLRSHGGIVRPADTVPGPTLEYLNWVIEEMKKKATQVSLRPAEMTAVLHPDVYGTLVSNGWVSVDDRVAVDPSIAVCEVCNQYHSAIYVLPRKALPCGAATTAANTIANMT